MHKESNLVIEDTAQRDLRRNRVAGLDLNPTDNVSAQNIDKEVPLRRMAHHFRFIDKVPSLTLTGMDKMKSERKTLPNRLEPIEEDKSKATALDDNSIANNTAINPDLFTQLISGEHSIDQVSRRSSRLSNAFNMRRMKEAVRSLNLRFADLSSY